MATREEVDEQIVRRVKTLTEEQAKILLEFTKLMLFSGTDDQWQARASALRERLDAQGLLVPEVIGILDWIWDERQNAGDTVS